MATCSFMARREPSKTELAVRSVAAELEMDEAQIRSDLERGEQEFDDIKLYKRVFALADAPVPRAMVPRIRLKSPKITRKLTTDWFATRVDERYERCLKRGAKQAN